MVVLTEDSVAALVRASPTARKNLSTVSTFAPPPSQEHVAKYQQCASGTRSTLHRSLIGSANQDNAFPQMGLGACNQSCRLQMTAAV